MGTMSRQLSKFLYEGFNTNQKRIYDEINKKKKKKTI